MPPHQKVVVHGIIEERKQIKLLSKLRAVWKEGVDYVSLWAMHGDIPRPRIIYAQ